MDGIGRSKAVSVLSLFTSGSTLVCCALPALLVALGMGAALSALVSAVPQLVWMSENKMGIFVIAAAMLMLSGYLQWRAGNLPCPADPELAARCAKTRKTSQTIYWFSLTLYAIGAFFAFMASALA